MSAGGGGGNLPEVYSIAVQTDGKILVGGNFTVIGGQTRPRLARLNVDGTVDLSFNPNPSGGMFGIPLVNALVIQPDGKILVGGRFATVDGQTRNNIVRLNADGTVDAFNPNANSMVKSLALQADGKVLMGGSFFTVGGQTRNNFARVNADGSLDTTFNPNVNSDVVTIAVQTDGKL